MITRHARAKLARLLALLAAAACLCGSAMGQNRDLEISLEAASSEIDRRNDRLIFNDVEIRQGTLTIRAEQAVGTGLSFENSDWTFSRAVKLTSDGAVIEADEAVLSFRAHRLARARLVGRPVTFERASTQVAGQIARGRAARVDYDVDTGSVRLAGDAWLCEGSNEITSETIVYDIEAERVLADGGEDGDGRVRIVITPQSESEDVPGGCGEPPPFRDDTAEADTRGGTEDEQQQTGGDSPPSPGATAPSTDGRTGAAPRTGTEEAP